MITPTTAQSMTDSYFNIHSSQPSSELNGQTLSMPNLVDSKTKHVDVVPKNTTSATQYPGLQLSGRVISATVCIPYELGHAAGDAWKITPRRGTSALFDAFSYLGKSSAWTHTVVGWTGEIYPAKMRTIPDTVARANHKVNQQRTKAYSPRNSLEKSYDPKTHILNITAPERKLLDTQLAGTSSSSTIVPVWMYNQQESSSHRGNSIDNLQLKDQGRWRRFAERDLYTIFHYGHQAFEDDETRAAAWTDYVSLNRAIANQIVDLYKPGDLLFIHDYHLMLVPALIRKQFPNAYISFFLHIPFPSSEYIRELPQRKEIMSGMLGADVVAFQAVDFARHFGAACRQILGINPGELDVEHGLLHRSARTRFETIPTGVDGAAISQMAFHNIQVERELEQLRRIHAGKKIIIGRDRLETVSGVSQKLEAFEKFLELHAEWRKRVILIQITGPISASDERKNTKYESLVSSLVSRINGKYGSIDHEPVRHYAQYFPAEQYSALLRLADVGLITSVRDGMNTTGLEFVICQEGNYSPLMLSEFSGTAASLHQAVCINPWNYKIVAARLKDCLEMSHDAKRTMHEQLYEHVMDNSSGTWAEKLITSLCTSAMKRELPGALPHVSPVALKERYQNANSRLFMFDYDGTLSKIEQRPEAAIPTPHALKVLECLAQDAKNQVWIVSGRDSDFLQNHLGYIESLGLSAEHGCFVRLPNSTEWTNLATRMDMTWQELVHAEFENATHAVPGSWIEKKKVALTWHYRFAQDYAQGETEAAKCKAVLEQTVSKNHLVDVLAGKANLEVRPRLLNKGYMAKTLINQSRTDKGYKADFVLCVGDDQTDEDMFKALLDSQLDSDSVFACTVGPPKKQTLATYVLEEPEDVVNIVEGLAQVSVEFEFTAS